METKHFFLKSLNIASNLSETQINELCDIAYRQEAKKGKIIDWGTDTHQKVYLIISGKVKIAEINEEGDEMVKDVVSSGDLFGAITLGARSSSEEYGEVISEMASFYAFDLLPLNRVMENNPLLTLNFLNKLSEKFKRLENRYVNMVSKDVKSRLMYFFREWAQSEGKSLGDRVVVKNYFTHNDLASLIFTSRQTVTLIINELRNSGDIHYTRKEIAFPSVMLAS